MTQLGNTDDVLRDVEAHGDVPAPRGRFGVVPYGNDKFELQDTVQGRRVAIFDRAAEAIVCCDAMNAVVKPAP